MINKSCFLLLLLLSAGYTAFGQKLDSGELAKRIDAYKKDIRGPYKDLRWFCTDGSIRGPKDPCPDEIGPGVQHARYKDEVASLGEASHIFFGQILAATDPELFWDAGHNHSRLKQYQLGHYLESVDDGWIMRKAQYYRGAIQSEDEAAWGREFYTRLLKDPAVITKDFFLIRQSMKTVPHSGDTNLAQKMRSASKTISDGYPPFMDLRVKIHGQPEASDMALVRSFRQKHLSALTGELQKEMDGLLAVMAAFYKPVALQKVLAGMTLLKDGPLANALQFYSQAMATEDLPAQQTRHTAGMLLDIRDGLAVEKRPAARLQLLDLSLKLEEMLFKIAPSWEPVTLEEGLDKICNLGMAATGAGYLEIWEWEELLGALSQSKAEKLTLADLSLVLESARAAVEWSAAMVKTQYQETVTLYAGFEPLANGFIDDQIRGSVALQLGSSVSLLGNYLARESQLTNKVMDLTDQSNFRGLNPGYALGELVVVEGASDEVEVRPDKIYIFQRAPSDLKPVAGIATVAEGNLVSHVQLLARNLGIPNAALSDRNLSDLRNFNGKRIFYAVSNRGNVIMKPENQMTATEKALFEKKERSDERIAVPVDKIQLGQKNILNLRSVDASDSGSLCGPKAANLGQLKKLFPDKVVEGLVIPFGIFREHMDLEMPGQDGSYWEFLNAMFRKATEMQAAHTAEDQIESYQLQQLEILRGAIKNMNLMPAFVRELEEEFRSVLGMPLGELPVFLRSDTNMEDLKDFTGAGLNLTLFNVADKEKIISGIKDVWASPYTERSFKWRQQYLLNPENVFPSILVIPSVDVDCSGVLITKGINAGNENDLTLAFSRGAGGAVDGQAAETYLIRNEGGHRLLAPSREAYYNRLPVSGGTLKKSATFESPILKPSNLNQVRSWAHSIRSLLPKATDAEYRGAYDVELGFKGDTLWLFQVRPFVENKKALSSAYLESISPKIQTDKPILLATPIK